MAKEIKKFTEGPILKALLTLSIPIMLANMFQSLYSLTDTFWVGRLGTNAVAAVSISFPIIFLLISMGAGLATAGAILVSQYKGSGDTKKVNHVCAQTLIMMVTVSIITSLIGYFLSPFAMRIMGAENAIMADAVGYLQISFIGIVFLFGFFVFQALMRGIGDVKTPFIIVFATVLLNLILDPLFIMGYGWVPAYGVRGAAIATIGTQGLATLIGFIMIFGGRHEISLKIKDLKPDFKLLKKMFKLGLPASVEQSTRALGMTIITALVAVFGSLALAAYGIGIRIFSFIIIPAIGLSMAVSTVVGQNIGAEKIDRAEKTAKQGALLSFVSLTFVGILIFIFARTLSAFFIPGEEAAIATSTLFIRIISLTFGFIGVQQVLNGTFRGSGNTSYAMAVSLVAVWLIQFPSAYLLSRYTNLGETGIWWSFAISNIGGCIFAIILLSRGTWKKKRLIGREEELQEKVTEETIVEEGI